MDAMTHIAPGELPPFWDRSVIFFANLLSLFYGNRAQTEELAAHVGGINSYGGRLLPVIDILFRRGDNLLVLERAPSLPLADYFKDELGLTLPEVAVLDDAAYASLHAPVSEAKDEAALRLRRRIHQHPARWVDGFVTDRRLAAVAEAVGKQVVSSVEGSRRGNNKYLLHRHMAASGYATFDTLLAGSAAEVPPLLEDLRARGYARTVLKAQVGASGFGMLRLPVEGAHADQVPAYMFFEGPCLVQGWLGEEVAGVNAVGSPSVQLFLDEETAHLYDLTEQVLSAESIHEGNLAPPPCLAGRADVRAECLEQAAEAARWLHAQGYRGTASVDLLVIERGGRPEVRVCEVNARVTGATYPAVLARHFMPHAAWLMRNLRFRSLLDAAELLAMLRRAGLLFRPGMPAGILPFNFNPAPEGDHIVKGQFLCLAATLEACGEMLQKGESILPVEWDYDRD